MNAVVDLYRVRQKHATISGGLVIIAQHEDCFLATVDWSSLNQCNVKSEYQAVHYRYSTSIDEQNARALPWSRSPPRLAPMYE